MLKWPALKVAAGLFFLTCGGPSETAVAADGKSAIVCRASDCFVPAILAAGAKVCSVAGCFSFAEPLNVRLVNVILPDYVQVSWIGQLLLTKFANITTNVRNCHWGTGTAGNDEYQCEAAPDARP